ncbi:type II secretion system minor pseudopilin GspK [Methylomonas methanica]|uniref:Type II secretion system protein K n=1 Tax=Methylomonas methanica (strain DSM 25384 / MC09) TaxID=857087 RepID=G0A760_METMM|nr:type II secretion system minor pseudopilin GspK [Methylomonas methanica]AEF99353.1 general secretion pathway protein K [Methylomonas methanica MC09]
MRTRLNPTQHGVALITVLLVLALATVTIVSMSSERQLDIRRTENQLRGDQAWAHALSLENWAVKRLQDGDWQKPLRISEDGEVELRGKIDDLQGRLNLNNLFVDGKVSEEDRKRVQRLFDHLEIDSKLMDAILDWLDADGEIRYPSGAEDEAYSRKHPPRRAANRLFADVSELLLVQGVTPEIYDKLRPFIYVAPGYAPVNVNTAPPEVLRCLADKISADQAASMYRASGKPFSELAEFFKDEAVVGRSIGPHGLSVQSTFFLLSGSVDMGRARLRFESQLQKRAEQMATVIRRARSGWLRG